MKTLTLSVQTLKVMQMLNNAKKNSPTGVHFVSVKGYTNSSGETANHLINVGISYDKAKQRDIKRLQKFDINTYVTSFDKAIVLQAVTELLNSLIKPSETRSNGQIDAYTSLGNGMRIHNETGALYLYGFRRSKTVITKGEYKTVNSSQKTLAKNEIKKRLLSTGKFVNYVMNDIKIINANGKSLVIG